jgi:Protein of unknown function (DUF3142)
MKLRTKKFVSAALALLISHGCKPKTPTRNRLNENRFPSIILWAWERPEDLEFLDPHRYAVAFLAQTLTLKGEDVVSSPRHQPLKVAPETGLIAVTRVESQKTTGQRAALTPMQRERLVTLILKTLELNRVSAIQIDFDAASSERDFYRALLRDLRAKLPDSVPLSMTALASFCVGDRWLSDLPVDEAVPMIFRMGADDRSIKNLLSTGNDFGEELCRRSYGIALDEPLEMKFEKSRRLYVFNNHAWTERDIATLEEKIR